jgi:hypothetical protein
LCSVTKAQSGVVGTDWRVDLEPGRELDEEFHVCVVVEVAGELLLDLRLVLHCIEETFLAVLHFVKVAQVPDDPFFRVKLDAP